MLKREATSLLRWYEHCHRDLPWRGVEDPYCIWISEIMLQQTRTRTVIPYYRSFIESYPTVELLAAAPIGDVLAIWSGLGYYRRAHQLHRAAQEIVLRNEGFPQSAHELKKLPGIGPYTAAAIASISFSEVVPVLDGNVERVLSRYIASVADPRRKATREVLLEKAAELLDSERPGDSNQAMMELGATICLPKRPLCGSCPLVEGCLGFKNGDPENYPHSRKRRQVEKISWAVVIHENCGQILFFRRSEMDDLMPGMWELPNVPYNQDSKNLEKSLEDSYGGNWKLEGLPSFKIRHSITYRSIELYVYKTKKFSGDVVKEESDVLWITPGARSQYGLSSMYEKILIRCQREFQDS